MEEVNPSQLSVIEYVTQISAHRSRLLRVAKIVCQNHPLAIRVVDWHDAEKWLVLPGLLIFKNHNKPKLARRFYDMMNRLGDLISSIVFFGESNAFPEEYIHAKNLERVLDVLDRAQDPITPREFGRSTGDWQKFLSNDQLKIADEIIKLNAWKNEFPSCNLIG